ncbi:site-specific integrase [Cellulomonas endophytica]|uniref:site-specific integrase n=1 Tax=Cellulomonas endophytica TaxID=2494735 RepID=UPI0010124EF1|nr:site-specific integrase [Cellulomonas endophytica]
MARPRPAPDPERYAACARCVQAYKPAARWPEGMVCQYCYLAAKRTEGSCAACDHRGVLPGRDAAGRATCRACSGITLNVDCVGCGREAELHSRERCWACVLNDQVRDLLTGPAGRVPEALEQLARALGGMPRANSGVTWLRSVRVQQLLRGMAAGTIPLTHEALDALPTSRTVEYIRGLLVEQAVLPRRDRRVADFERWLERRLATIERPEQHRTLERYARWHHLRRLRAQSATAPVSEAAFTRAKQCVTVAGQFLLWLTDGGLTLDQVRQQHIDQWYSHSTGTAVHVETFLYWARQQRLLPREITIPRRAKDAPVTLGEQQRLTALRAILVEDRSPLQVRVLAGLVLLFAQPVNRLTRLTVDDVDLTSEAVRIRFTRHWAEVPEPFASLLAAHVAARPNRSTAANATSHWLFPGTMPGQPLKPGYVTTLLSEAGVPALPTRAATWRQLARQAPPAILAEMLGASPSTAMRYAELAGADYLHYAAPVERREAGHRFAT